MTKFGQAEMQPEHEPFAIEKLTLIEEIDSTTMDIDFIKNELAHIYGFKSKYARNFNRPIPLHLFERGLGNAPNKYGHRL